MRSMPAWVLGGAVLASCARPNPAFSDAGGGTMGSAEGSGSGPASTSSTSDGSTGSGTGSSASTSDDTTSTGGSGTPPLRCSALPMVLLAPVFDGEDQLDDVPVLIDLSQFERPIEANSLRFLEGEDVLAHELTAQATLAWVRIPHIQSGADVEFQAVMGPECPSFPDSPPRADVWSNGYVAVFHFDVLEAGAFVDSVRGVRLMLNDGTSLSKDVWQLGGYAVKTDNMSMQQTTDEALDISGKVDLSVMGWVRIDDDAAGVLPWQKPNARHREVLSKLPGYRLTAVRGQSSSTGSVVNQPFFNISASIEPPQNDLVFGNEAVPPGDWTMLSGSFTPGTASLYVGADEVSTSLTTFLPGIGNNQGFTVGRLLRGGIDEVRVSSVARSPDWVLVQHLSMTGGLVEYDAPVPY